MSAPPANDPAAIATPTPPAPMTPAEVPASVMNLLTQHALGGAELHLAALAQQRISVLQAELDAARKQRAELAEKHSADLIAIHERHDKRVSELTTRIARLEEDIRVLRQKNDTLSANNERLEKQNSETQERLARLERSVLKDKYSLMLGSIAFNYVAYAKEFVLGKAAPVEIKSLSAIEDAAKAQGKRDRWDAFKNQFYKQGFDEVLADWKQRRKQLAHPISMDDENEACDSPKDLQAIIEKAYNRKRTQKDAALFLVECLDKLSRTVGQPLLQSP